MGGRSTRLLVPAIVLLVLSAAGCSPGGDDREVVARPTKTPPEQPEPTEQTTTDPSTPSDEVDPDPVRVETVPGTDPEVSGSGLVISARARKEFAAIERAHPGRLGVAVMPVGVDAEPETIGTLQTGVAWSTAKVPVALAVLRNGATAGEQADVRRALTASDNAAAQRLWDRLGGGERAAVAAETVLRESGDDETSVESRGLRSGFTAFGQTRWSLANQARFMATLPCLSYAPPVLRAMGEVVPGQRWGLGTVGASPLLKGGWGPGTEPGVAGGYLDRQMGRVTVNGRTLAVAVAAEPSAGSHAAGIAALDALAGWVADLKPATPPTASSC